MRGRGGTTRGKRGVKTPAFTGRRSKEERDAIAKELAARDRERTKEQVAADKRREAEAAKAARREASKLKNARGGFSGVASGPFSLGSSKEGMSIILAVVVCTNLSRQTGRVTRIAASLASDPDRALEQSASRTRTGVMEGLVPGQAGAEAVEVEVEVVHQSREKMVALCHLMTKI